MSATTVVRRADGALRAYSGLLAAAFEHVFVSSRPLASVGAGTPADVLPVALDVSPGAAAPGGIDGLLRGLMRDALAVATVIAS